MKLQNLEAVQTLSQQRGWIERDLEYLDAADREGSVLAVISFLIDEGIQTDGSGRDKLLQADGEAVWPRNWCDENLQLEFAAECRVLLRKFLLQNHAACDRHLVALGVTS